MENRVALLGSMVENSDSIKGLNQLLHQHKEYVVGRMGIPYQKRNVNIISIVLDAPADVISRLAGKIGMLPGITAKTVSSKLQSEAQL